MTIERQHEQFLKAIRNGEDTAANLVGRYEPFTTSNGCVKHMFMDDDKCPDCARRARERNEDRMVDKYREELWKEQRYYDAEAARDAKDKARRETAKAPKVSPPSPAPVATTVAAPKPDYRKPGSKIVWSPAITLSEAIKTNGKLQEKAARDERLRQNAIEMGRIPAEEPKLELVSEASAAEEQKSDGSAFWGFVIIGAGLFLAYLLICVFMAAGRHFFGWA